MTGQNLKSIIDTPAVSAQKIFERACTLFDQGKYDEVVALYEGALQSNASDHLLWLNLGITLRIMERYEAALVCFTRAMDLYPGMPVITYNYALCLHKLDRVAEALKAYAAYVGKAPDDHEARLYYSSALANARLFPEALAQLEEARKRKPDDLSPLWTRASINLTLGRFEEAWEDFESRWKLQGHSDQGLIEWEKTAPSKRWRGEDLKGKTILIYREQGFGDTILASRYVPQVKALGARVLLACHPSLRRFFSALPGVDLFWEESVQERIDYHCPIMSLPGLFKTTLDTIPPPVRFPVPDELPAEAKRLLELGKGRYRVGIVWSGSQTFSNNKKRSAAFTRFLPLAEIPGIQLYSLQKGPQEKELTEAEARGVVIELGPHLNDFADTAAVLKQLDLVVMTDSAVAHLAGTIGCPVWNLLSYETYWLYLLEREDSPWYPSMRLFRQPERGDWDSVFKRVKAELEKAIALKALGK